MSDTEATRTRLVQLRDEAQRLADILAQLRSFGPVATEVGRAQGLAVSLLGGLGDLAAQVSGGPGAAPRATPAEATRSDFAHAIASLANAMVTAQRNLDRASIDYSRERGGNAARVPTSFRIPKMTAGFHFSIDRVDERGIDLLLWHSNSETRERNQQSVSFDIVAVPPTPDFLATIETGLPRARLLATRAERAPWLQSIPSLPTMPDAWKDSVLLAEVPRSGAATEIVDVLAGYTERPAQPDRLRLGVWRLTRADIVRAEALVELGDYDATAPARSVPAAGTAAGTAPQWPVARARLLHDLLLPWCEAQAAFLAPG